MRLAVYFYLFFIMWPVTILVARLIWLDDDDAIGSAPRARTTRVQKTRRSNRHDQNCGHSFIALGLFGVVVATAFGSAKIRRIWLMLSILLTLRFPMTTIDFHMGVRHNVRGWEIAWNDPIVLGLILVQLARFKNVHRLFSVMSLLWMSHIGILLISSVMGVDLEFSLFYVFRQIRGLLMFFAVVLVLESRADFRAILMSLSLACVFNEHTVLKQKYIEGRFQCPGLFDHQNAMSMYMGLIGPVLVASLLLKPMNRLMIVVVVIALLSNMHAVLAALSRAGMVVWAGVCGLAAMSSLLNGVNKHKAVILGGASTAGIVVVLAMLPTLIKRFGDDSANKASHRTREVMNDAAVLMYQDRPCLVGDPITMPMPSTSNRIQK